MVCYLKTRVVWLSSNLRYETEGQFIHDVDLWVDLHHPHVRNCYGACHVGEHTFAIHQYDDYLTDLVTDSLTWTDLLGCARGLEYVHGFGLVHQSLTCNDFVVTKDQRGALSGLGLIQRSEAKNKLSKNEQQPSLAQDIFALGICIFDLLTGSSEMTKTQGRRLPVNRPSVIKEEEWELLNLMCSLNPVDRIGIRNIVYRMEQLENRKNYRLHNNVYVNTVESEVSGSAVETIEVVEDLSLFVVNTLDLTLEETLSEVELSCDELPDFSAVNQPVLSRLKDIFFKFQATVDPLPLAVVERFSLILVQFLDSLD